MPRLTVLLLLVGASATARAQAPDGKALFQRGCAICHSIEPGLNMAGPSLAGLIGRKVASVDGALYSPAMKGHGGVWTATALDPYLANPQAVVPGTSMVFSVPDATERKAIIAYLESATAVKPSKKKAAAH